MEQTIYLVDVIDIPDESVLKEYYQLARGYLRGYTANRYTAIQYETFMNRVFDGKCILGTFVYLLDTSENISREALVDAILVKHHMYTKDSLDMQYELSYIDSYTTNGVEWYCTESMMDYCIEAVCSTQSFVDVMFACYTEVLKYVNCSACIRALQSVMLRMIIPTKEDVLASDYSIDYLYYYFNEHWDTTGLVYWFITTQRFLYG